MVTRGSIPSKPIGGGTAKWWNGRHATLRTSCPQGVGVRISPWSLAAEAAARSAGICWQFAARQHVSLAVAATTTRVSQCSSKPHKLRSPGATPGPATQLRRRNADTSDHQNFGPACRWRRPTFARLVRWVRLPSGPLDACTHTEGSRIGLAGPVC